MEGDGAGGAGGGNSNCGCMAENSIKRGGVVLLVVNLVAKKRKMKEN